MNTPVPRSQKPIDYTHNLEFGEVVHECGNTKAVRITPDDMIEISNHNKLVAIRQAKQAARLELKQQKINDKPLIPDQY